MYDTAFIIPIFLKRKLRSKVVKEFIQYFTELKFQCLLIFKSRLSSRILRPDSNNRLKSKSEGPMPSF